MSAPMPFSLNFRLEWPPLLEFLEQRTAVLRLLDSIDLLVAFTTSEGRVGARLSEHEVVEFLAGRCEVALFSPAADLERVESALDAVLKLLDVEGMVLVDVSMQTLLPIVGSDAKSATQRFAQLVAIAPALIDTGSDAAVLLDGSFSTGGEVFDYQVEFGVISGAEAPARLGRHAGRISSHTAGLLSVLLDDEVPVPQVSAFGDWHFVNTEPMMMSRDLDQLMSTLDSLSGFSGRSAEELQQQLTTID